MKLDVQTLDGKKGGSVDLDDAIFGIKEIRADILQRMVKYQLAKRRAGTHKTQTPRRSLALALQALQAKGHGPGASRRGERADLPGRRSRAQSSAARLLARPDQEVPRAGAAPRALGQGQCRRHRRDRRADGEGRQDLRAAEVARQAEARKGAVHRRRFELTRTSRAPRATSRTSTSCRTPASTFTTSCAPTSWC